MKLIIERSFGRIEIENSDSKELIKEVSFWQTLPNECPKCKTPLNLFYRSPQENDYYGLVCTGRTRHETNFGQYKKGGLYYKNDWHDAYQGVVAERDAEIAKYDDKPTIKDMIANDHERRQSEGFAARINKAIVAIKDLGVNPEPRGRDESDKEYLESLTEQYRRIKQTKGASK